MALTGDQIVEIVKDICITIIGVSLIFRLID